MNRTPVVLSLVLTLYLSSFHLFGDLTYRQQSVIFSLGCFGTILLFWPAETVQRRRVAVAPGGTPPVTKIEKEVGIFSGVAPQQAVHTEGRSPVKPNKFQNTYASGTIEHLIHTEIDLINYMLRHHSIEAKALHRPTRRIRKPILNVQCSFIAYRLEVKPGQSLDKIEKVLRELSNALTDNRQRYPGNKEPTVARLRDFPPALEVPHPDPIDLTWKQADFSVGDDKALVGRSYDFSGANNVVIDLTKDFHTIVAGMSGFGKSVVMRMALTTLVLNNKPGDLQLIIIDLKNDDLAIFRNLPHCVGFAMREEDAVGLIEDAYADAQRRIASGLKPYRLVVAIDELAEINDKTTQETLARLMKLGRSLWINVIAGTQYPSAEEIGTQVSKSFTIRFVSKVADATSAHFITKMNKSGAERISTPGDFLMVRNELTRIKTYWLPKEENIELLRDVFGSHQTDIGSDIPTRYAVDMARYSSDTKPILPDISARYEQSPVVEGEKPASQGKFENFVEFPIGSLRPLNQEEMIVVWELAEQKQFQYRGVVSYTKLVPHVYGSRDPQRTAFVKEALEQKPMNSATSQVWH